MRTTAVFAEMLMNLSMFGGPNPRTTWPLIILSPGPSLLGFLLEAELLGSTEWKYR